MIGKARWILGSNLAASFTRFFSVMILARLLTPYDYGVYSSAFIVLGFTTNLSELGFGQSMIQLKRLESRHIGTGYSISLVIGLTLSVIVFAGADALSSILRVPETASVLRVVALIVPLRSMAIVTESLLKRDLRMRTLAILQYGSMLIGNVFVTIALAWMGFGYWALVGGFLAMHLVTAAWLVVATEHTLGLRLDLASARELLPKGDRVQRLENTAICWRTWGLLRYLEVYRRRAVRRLQSRVSGHGHVQRHHQ